MNERYHFLDGLRGAAMLLGLVLHGVLSFAGVEGWLAVDVKSAPEILMPLMDWIHGFRMPLFFMVSGFFTTMMWRKRGMGGLLKQRLLRIGVPLVVGVIIVFPVMAALAEWGGEVKAERAGTESVDEEGGIFWAVLAGDEERVKTALEAGGDVNAKDDFGSSLLHLAAIADDGEMVELLLEEGAALEGRGNDGGTALMSACFFGREESAMALIEAGADVSATNTKGESVMWMAVMDFEAVKMVGEAFQIEVTDEHRLARERLAKILEERGAESTVDDGFGWYWMGVFWPVFHHLWFLYDLLWLLVLFVPIAWVAGKLGWKLPDILIGVPGCLLWLIPLTWWFQTMMPGQFGPGTSTGIFPWPAKVGYYGVFFFFGAMCFGRGLWEKEVGRNWWGWLLVSLPLWWFGKEWAKEGHSLGAWAASAFAWTTIVGMMGLFRRFLNEGRPRLRYLSDSSYWLYLAHLPVMIVVQILISGWEVPLVLKLVIVIGGVTAVLLVIYDVMVRYTWIGAILNGRKSRVQPPPLPQEKQEV